MLGRSPATGRWTSVAANTPRFDIDPLTLESRGVLVEPGSLQLVYRNRTPLYTTRLASSLTDTTQQTPFGLGALKLTPTATFGQHGFDFTFTEPRSSIIPNDTTVGIQIVLKPEGAYSRASLSLLGRDGVVHVVNIALEGAGAILSSGALSATIQPDTDGYYVIKLVHNFAVGQTTPALVLTIQRSDGALDFAADGTSHFHVAYLGVEIGNEVTTPMINPGDALLQRTPETLLGTVNWIGSSQRASFAINYMPIGETGTVMEVSGNAGNNLKVRNATGFTSYAVTAQGSPVAIINGARPPAGFPGRMS